MPVRLPLAEFSGLAKRFNVSWTPTLLTLDQNEVEHHRAIGFLPPEEFKPQLDFAVGIASFNQGDFPKAKESFQHIVDHHAKALVAPDAWYWLGVSHYKGDKNLDQLMTCWKTIMEKHPQSPWATKVSFIKGK